MTDGAARFTAIAFAAGLALRLVGLGVNGMLDIDIFVFKWGASVVEDGLARAFGDIYGVLSYGLFGLATALAELTPRFWWAPYKLLEIAFEAAVFVALCALVPAARRPLVAVLYWLNPWFIVHGAWQGFWDAPHTLFALLAVLTFFRLPTREPLGWAVAGVMLTLAAMLKPQGLFFIVPVLIYIGLRWWEGRGPALPAFVLGVTVTYALTTLFLVLGGGRAGAIARNYMSVGQDAPFLCVECINVWRPIVRVLQAVLGQSGRTYDLRLPEPLYSALLLGAQALALTLVFAFALTLIAARAPSSAEARGRRLGTFVRGSAAAGLVLVVAGLARVSGTDQNPVVFGRYSVRYAGILALAALVAAVGIVVAPVIGRVLGRVPELARRAGVDGGAGASGEAAAVLLLLAFAALVIPQIGGQAHINHAYAGLVLTIPAAVARRKILAAWSVMVVAQLVAHLSVYQLGRSLVVPEYTRRSGAAGTLLDAIERAAPASDPWLRFQTTATRLLRDALPQEPLLTLLAAAQFLAFLVIVRELFAMAAALPADACGRATTRAGRAPLAIAVGER